MGQRNSLMDIVKAVGIISIVIGHCCSDVYIPFINVSLGRFVYSYHLMIFFFVAGFLFREGNADEPDGFIGRRLIQLISMISIYNIVFVTVHNGFARIGILSENTFYDFPMIIRKILDSFLFHYSEQLLGAFWFLPMYFIAIALFCMVVHYTKKMKKPMISQLCFCVLFAIIALYANIHQITWGYEMQTSLLAVPVLFAGFFCKIYWRKVEKVITWYGALISAVIILLILSLNIGSIELSVNSIIHPALFYPVTFLGIYFCIGAGRLLEKNVYVRKIFSVIGKNSFHIMAMHLLSFKLLDFLYAKCNNVTDKNIIGRFPHSDFGIHFSYIVLGVCFPLFIVWICRKGKLHWQERR